MRLLAIDPGKTTGVVILEWDGRTPSPTLDSLVTSAQIGFEDAPFWLDREVKAADLVIIERFVISARTIKYTRQPEPLHVIGGCVFLCRLHDKPYRFQGRSEALGAYSDARLKAWPVKGPHARDALRHALLATHRRAL